MGTSTFADVVVDTDGRTVSEVAGSVLELVRETLDDATRDRVDGRGVSQRTDDVAAPIHVDGPVLWLSGASAVGKSTVGWHVFQDALAAGRRTAFVDLEQIGFSCPARADDPSGHRVRARNLARLWSTFRSVGAECLVVVGKLGSAADLRPYTDALPDVTWSLCRLRADRHSLAERIALRRTGVGPDLAGDRLRHVDDDAATAALDAAVSASVVSDAAGLRWPVVDTDGATVDEIAQRVRAFAVGWPWPRVPS